MWIHEEWEIELSTKHKKHCISGCKILSFTKCLHSLKLDSVWPCAWMYGDLNPSFHNFFVLGRNVFVLLKLAGWKRTQDFQS